MQNNRKLRASIGVLIALLLLEGSTRWEPEEYIIYNHTPSVPTGIYLELPPNHLKKGDIVGFEPPEGMRELAESKGWIEKNVTMMKEIGAVAGQSYELTESNAFYADGKYIGQRIEKDSTGESMPSIQAGLHIIERGEVLLVSSHPYALDSRYFGTVPLGNVKFRAVRLVPFWE